MTLQDFLILLVLINLCLSLMLLVRLGSVRRELAKLRQQRVCRSAVKPRSKGSK